MTTLYGIKQCDTVRAARKWLQTHAIDFRFHDVREDGLTADDVTRWSATLDWQTLVNKRSTTWKQLGASERDGLDASNYVDLLLKHPTLIKRPVLEAGGRCLIGFKDTMYRDFFAKD